MQAVGIVVGAAGAWFTPFLRAVTSASDRGLDNRFTHPLGVGTWIISLSSGSITPTPAIAGPVVVLNLCTEALEAGLCCYAISSMHVMGLVA